MESKTTERSHVIKVGNDISNEDEDELTTVNTDNDISNEDEL